MAPALVIIARRLRHYFLSHPIGVKTDMPLKQTLEKLDTSRRLVKCPVELSEYDISYLLRTTIKSQSLADFVSEMAGTLTEDASKVEKRLLHVDGFHNSRQWCKHSHHFALWKRFRIVVVKSRLKASKDEAEHEALVIDMRMAHDLGYHQIMLALKIVKKSVSSPPLVHYLMWPYHSAEKCRRHLPTAGGQDISSANQKKC
ncbi:hypothetical protein Sango_2838200 [Sesamum angolense]|uniref:Uncharacterized protein n=1 Tax=Sesamum angolense TaxID=2727404 RepID=A0AAE1T7A9_9LAMI|nr:hypothetical protein Sango_2838200 [Sesamum angolense]